VRNVEDHKEEHIDAATIRREIGRYGYYYLDGVGRLRANAVPRTIYIWVGVLGLLWVLSLVSCVTGNLARSKDAANAYKNSLELDRLRQQASDQRAAVSTCYEKLETYRTELTQAETQTQAAMATNPNLITTLRIIELLKKVL
jgi:hypothetical protein